MSAIRIVDRIILTLEEELKEGDTTAPYLISCLLRFGSHRLSTEHTLTIKFKNPIGEETLFTEQPLTFRPEKSGVNFMIRMNLGFRREGTYWLLVYLDNNLVTQVPLLVEFRVAEGESSDSQTTVQPES